MGNKKDDQKSIQILQQIYTLLDMLLGWVDHESKDEQ